MWTVRAPLALLGAILSVALLHDLGAVAAGAQTADAYYLPLRSIPVGGDRNEIERSLIETHGELLKRQRRIWLALHGAALGCALLALAGSCRPISPPGVPAGSGPVSPYRVS